MLKKLLAIFILGMSGLQAMDKEEMFKDHIKQEAKKHGHILEIAEKALSPDYRELPINQKLTRLVNAFADINQFVWEQTNFFERFPNLKKRVIAFNKYIDNRMPQEKYSKKDCQFFLTYMKDQASWNQISIGYAQIFDNLKSVCFGILLQEFQKDKKNLDSLSKETLEINMNIIQSVLDGFYFGPAIPARFREFLKSKFDSINYAISVNAVFVQKLIELQQENEKNVQPYVTENKAYYQKLFSFYMDFAKNLNLKIVQAKTKKPEQALESSMKKIEEKKEEPKKPTPSRIEQIRAWAAQAAKRVQSVGWKPLVGIGATLAAAGYAIYHWFAGSSPESPKGATASE